MLDEFKDVQVTAENQAQFLGARIGETVQVRCPPKLNLEFWGQLKVWLMPKNKNPVKYYLWIGAMRFELSRPMTRWERVKCWLSGNRYETKEDV